MGLAVNSDGSIQSAPDGAGALAADCGCCAGEDGLVCICPLPPSVTLTTTGALPTGWTVTSGSWNGPWSLPSEPVLLQDPCAFALETVVEYLDEFGNPGSLGAFVRIGPPQLGVYGIEIIVLAPGYGGDALGDVCCRSSYTLNDLNGTSATVDLGGDGDDDCPCSECCRPGDSQLIPPTLQFVTQVCDVVRLTQQIGCNWKGGLDGCRYQVWRDDGGIWRSNVVCPPDPIVYAAHSTTDSACPPATGWVGDPTAIPLNLCCQGDDCPCSGTSPCPTDCTACADTLTVTISGGTTIDGTYTFDKNSSPTGCTWNANDSSGSEIACDDTTAIPGEDPHSWHVVLLHGSDEIDAVAHNTAGCPPASGWTILNNSAGGTPVITIT